MNREISIRKAGWFKLLQKHWSRIIVHASAIFLTARLVWLVLSGAFFIDPVRQSTTMTGKLAITYLLLSLSCTPVNILSGWAWVMQMRRSLGLYAFGFALIHGLIYVAWDYQFDIPLLLDSILYQRYVLVGAAAFLLLSLLALTSIQPVRRRISKIWSTLQRLVYAAIGFATVHVLWLRKTYSESIPLLVILATLFIIRVPWFKKGLINIRKSITAGVR